MNEMETQNNKKIVWQEAQNIAPKVLFCLSYENEDELFLKIKCADGTIFHIAKRCVISIKECE